MPLSRFVAFILAAIGLAACSADSGPKEVGGTAVGAVAGGLLGNAIGGSAGNRVAGTLIGAAFGGFLGNRIGEGPTPRKCRPWKAGHPARPLPGAIRIPGAMAMWCQARPTK
jgi:hypothetical protein